MHWNSTEDRPAVLANQDPWHPWATIRRYALSVAVAAGSAGFIVGCLFGMWAGR